MSYVKRRKKEEDNW